MEEEFPMRAKGLVQAIIGAGGFVLEDVTVNAEMNEIKLAIRPTKREQCRCGICHRKVVRYDKGVAGGSGVAWMWVHRGYTWRRSSRGYAAQNTVW